MRVFDCHFHIESGLEKYDISVSGKNVIFNEYGSYIKHQHLLREGDTVTLIFDYKDHFEEIKSLMAQKKIAALKIHNRIQRIAEQDYPALMSKLDELQPTVPIVIDAFYFGDDIDFQPSLKQIIYIAKKFPATPVVVAHCGGIEILKYFYHLKSLDNIFFDLSFSLVYLKNTSVFVDFKNLLKFGNTSKIMFGTDYPFVSAKQQLSTFIEMAEELRLSGDIIDKILFSNAQALFK